MKISFSANIKDAEKLIDILKKNHTTKSTAIKTEMLLKNYLLSYSPRYLRAVVELIRKNDLTAPAFLVSNTCVGYWLTSDVSEMKSFLNQELDRVSNQVENINTLRQRLMAPKKNTHSQQLFISMP